MPDEKKVPFSHGAANRNLKPADVSPGEETVVMQFPRKVILTLDTQQRVEFPAGLQEVPAHLVNHPYLKAHGVTVFKGKVVNVPAVEEGEGEDKNEDESADSEQGEDTQSGDEAGEQTEAGETSGPDPAESKPVVAEAEKGNSWLRSKKKK